MLFDMEKSEIKKELIQAGVKNLKEFGYNDVNEENIMNDSFYSSFFQAMLNDNLGVSKFDSVNDVIKELISDIESR